MDDCGSLDIVKPETLAQSFLTFGDGFACADDVDNLVDIIKGDSQSAQDMRPFLRFTHIVTDAAFDDIALEVD